MDTIIQWGRRALVGAAVFVLSALASASQGPAGSDPATLKVFNREIITFRTSHLGQEPAQRALRARSNIAEALRLDSGSAVEVKANPVGKLVMLGPALLFIITPGDADVPTEEGVNETTQRAVRNLERVLAETQESRDLSLILRSLGVAAVATAVYALLVFGLQRLHRRLANTLVELAERKAQALTISGQNLLDTRSVVPRMRRAIDILRWMIVALLSYEWISFVLSRFPYTRPWGEQLNAYLYALFATIAEAVIDAFPGLILAATIFLIARYFVNFSGRLLTRITEGRSDGTWLNHETLPTTRRLLSIAIWLFALAMAYPYLPGAQTEAFKGLSVLLGLMVSLGASSIVGQGAAGLILTYTRTIRPGEYVRIGEHEGTVVEMGMFTTRIQTGLGEELTLPNSMITGTVTKNYSRVVRGRGYVVDTTVTIGYDTPWRQVEAMLIEAARRTPGILQVPAPIVFQTALSDYYPEYRVVAQAVPEQPRPRAEVLTLLHANIQDVFNEYGVQIMSPHYMGDPQEAKVVPPEGWYAAPAKRQDA